MKRLSLVCLYNKTCHLVRRTMSTKSQLNKGCDGNLHENVLNQSSNQHNTMLSEVVKTVPPLTFDSYKGQAGRIGIIGGCEEYTGAPFFAAISALKVGADLSHVFCTKSAAPVIKSYSPELIVHPVLDLPNAFNEIKTWLPRLHTVVIGPGLGRHQPVLDVVKSVIVQLRSDNIPMIIDADGLFLITQEPAFIQGYEKVILTPNKVEFDRLINKKLPQQDNVAATETALSNALDGVAVVRKGFHDTISINNHCITVYEQGSPCRCGGQGDLLSGAMAVFLHWALSTSSSEEITHDPRSVAAYGACVLTKQCAKEAFLKYGRSTTTTDLISEISAVFRRTFEPKQS